MRSAKCVLSTITDPPNPTFTYSRSGKYFLRSHLTIVELPTKNTLPGFGGLAERRFSMAVILCSHLANGSTGWGGGATGGCVATVKSSASIARTPGGCRGRIFSLGCL